MIGKVWNKGCFQQEVGTEDDSGGANQYVKLRHYQNINKWRNLYFLDLLSGELHICGGNISIICLGWCERD